MLQKLNFKPGFNKQATESGAEGQWTDGDFVRFRYGLPEKIGGWNQLTTGDLTLPGAARAQVAFSSFAGEKYTAIGTSQGLFLYYGNDFFDITPLDTAITGGTLTTVNGSDIVTIDKGSHGLEVGRYVTLSSVTVTGASDYTADELEKAYEILTVPTIDKFTVQAVRAEGGAGMTAAGSVTVNPYVEVGPTTQTVGFGWGTSTWSTSTWGTPRATSSVILDPGNWSLDNFGQVLVATIFNGRTFTWNAGATNARTIRASTTTTNFNFNPRFCPIKSFAMSKNILWFFMGTSRPTMPIKKMSSLIPYFFLNLPLTGPFPRKGVSSNPSSMVVIFLSRLCMLSMVSWIL